MIAIIVVAFYLLGAVVTVAYVGYRQAVNAEWWKDSQLDGAGIQLAAGLWWPIAWLIVIPFCAADGIGKRLGAQATERRQLRQAEEREVERAMKEL